MPNAGPLRPTYSPLRATQGPLRPTELSLGQKGDPLRLTEDHKTQDIQIDKWLSQTDIGLTQAVLSQIGGPKVDKGPFHLNTFHLNSS